MKFFKTPSRFLLVTGEAGYGEQEMVSNLMERLQLALSVDAKLLRASFGKFSPLTLDFDFPNYHQERPKVLSPVPHALSSPC